MPNPWIILALAAGLFAAGFGSAWNWRGALCEAAAAEKAGDSQKRKDDEGVRAHGAAAGLEVENAEAEKREAALSGALAEVTARPVYRADCADADGLRLIRAAFTGESAAAPEPHLPMPRPDAP
ncbi:hypothetical protein [Parvibaculum sp.]|mgnify:CR=1 FL=1|uniref:hypothetical protein n=1 Tax=Parvibaculum sp. TaxID=2024848 RepID=UPI000C4FD2F6|nr:hypothetical protein [Parvibaculum sp.]MAM95663.1 hypothetical protein [Parvibaculum sp.]|tara:strand:- start:12639 stop:13010 length:372 start_codon:yes stop_codon:yes gene_type:complete